MAKSLLTKKNFIIAPLSSKDSVFLHQIHKNCFSIAWTQQTFETFLKDHSIFGYKAHLIGQSHQILGFCLCRLILGEAEIITIAVNSNNRQQKIGHFLIDNIFRHLRRKRATKLFLEVEETNLPALALYKRFKFQKIAKRPAYYQSHNGLIDAIIMQKTFKQID
ncbi:MULTISPECIES: ribosomal protein S18-alanine N-acetyltransferase [unclassified Bartonella]|uniref:ribosomal protein S18-alanine N-acetyltransferase n=1 Tax=unclassified Bartonella TaxID=2645622 RepID=UPI00099A4D38|nr:MULTISPECIES: ribosomal protein S18-alanine N-acetyltransferase [unclassified Bartonella]AQX22404.1 ribosomal-protein-alanine N-acetyltransferase [Bartonella sp. 11B]AQX24853.1 ribosomal-protein-alanine N-acetyltransferase [Bartonella sp. Coyote22sub2]